MSKTVLRVNLALIIPRVECIIYPAGNKMQLQSPIYFSLNAFFYPRDN
jgi:hypothetical protein